EHGPQPLPRPHPEVGAPQVTSSKFQVSSSKLRPDIPTWNLKLGTWNSSRPVGSTPAAANERTDPVQETRVESALGASTLSLETGRLAQQADGAVVGLADRMVLVAATAGKAREGIDFFPLQVEYRERTSAAGKFPGGYIKREGRPTTKETLTSRLIDRPIRPLFPPDYFDEVQVI